MKRILSGCYKPLRRHLLHHNYRGKQRSLSSQAAAAPSQTIAAQAARNLEAGATPPLPVRVALIATTTAIGTPAFPVVGVVNFGLRYIVWDSSSRYLILGATTLLGAIGILVQFSVSGLLPIVYSYGHLFLPFAMANGCLGGAAYLVLDVAFGTARMASMPLTGAAMGAFVGLMGPVSGLYDHAFQWCYDIPEADGWFTYLLNNAVMLPISITTGAAVGLMMHPLMYYPIVGIRGVHWAKFSAPLLAGTTAIMAHLYNADYYNDEIFPPETFLTGDEKRGLPLVPRLHSKRLQVEDWSTQTGYQTLGTGSQARKSSQQKLEAPQEGTRRTDLVFDSKRKAWLHYVTNGAFGNDAALESIASESEMNRQGLRYFASDGAVAFILQQTNSEDKSSAVIVRKQLMQLANDLQAPSRRSKSDAPKTVERIEVASNGIMLLLESMNDTTRTKGTKLSLPEQRREFQIRKLVPGIMLYAREESEDTIGCSVESQLRAFGWTRVTKEASKKRISRDWKAGLNTFLTAEQAEATRRQVTWVFTGLSMVVMYGIFGSMQ